MPKKRSKKRSTRNTDLGMQLVKGFGVLAILVLLVVSAGVMARYILKRPPTDVPPAVQPTAPPENKQAKPTYEIFPKQETPPETISKLPQLPGVHPPMAAIVVDDIGYDRQIADQFLSLDAPLTFSVLPYGPHSQEIAAEARSKGHEIMLHLPMEPNEFPAVNPGPGALLRQMTADEFIGQLNADLDRIPGLKGVNNHMGSAISMSSERMRQIFSILKKKGLYYIDSRTTAETVARPSAELLQIPFTERDIFIDHYENEKFIRKQLHALIQRAQRQGFAVGIAHPHAVTYRVLSDFLPELKRAVELVPASMVVDAGMLARASKNPQ